MLFEELIPGKKPKAPSGTAILSQASSSASERSRRGTLGGIVLVASKVLRSLALLSAYHALHAGLTYPFFASCTLAMASVALLALQRPWVGIQIKGVQAWVKLAVQSALLGLGFVCWASGLHLCGPAVTMMLEYVEVIILRLCIMLRDTESGSALRSGKLAHAVRSLALFAMACFVIVWDTGVLQPPPAEAIADPSRLGDGEWGWEGSVDGGDNGTDAGGGRPADDVAPVPLDFAARTAGEFASGMFMLLLASALSAARKLQAVHASKLVGGPKRLFALSAPLAAAGLVPFFVYPALRGRHPARATAAGGAVGLVESHHMPLFAVMGLLVPFYAGNFADRNLPGGESARVGLFASVMSFVITWAVRMSPVALSSRVVALTVAFVAMALGEDARDDSVPLGVYSAPGIKGESSGWTAALARVRSYSRQALNNRQSRRIASFLLINFTFMGVEFAYGWWTNSLGLISDAVHMLFDCGALVLGLYGSLMSTWHPNSAHTYGYGRYEVLCGFANGVLLLIIASFVVFEALGRIFEPPDIASDRLLVVSVCGLLVNIVGLVVFSDVGHAHGGAPCPFHAQGGGGGGGHGHAHGAGGACQGGHGHGHSHGDAQGGRAHAKGHEGDEEGKRRIAMHGKKLLDGEGRGPGAAAGAQEALGAAAEVAGRWWGALRGAASRLLSVEGHDANMQAVYLHVLADTLGSAGVIVSSVLVQYRGWFVADPICSLAIGSLIFVSVLPLVKEAGGTLLQKTPTELLGVMPEIRRRAKDIRGVVAVESLHIWRQSSVMVVGTMRLLAAGEAQQLGGVTGDARSLLAEYGVTDTCVQVELVHTGKGGKRPPGA